MRLWNLNSFEDLGPQILQESTHSEFGRIDNRAKTSHRTSSIKVAMQVAALTVASLAVMVIGSTAECYITTSTALVADNTEHGQPPLSSMFSNRFSADWTAEHEQNLLEKMVASRGTNTPEDERIGLMDSSQQEAVDLERPRLPKGDLLALLRHKA